jgi:hypothetical protein
MNPTMLLSASLGPLDHLYLLISGFRPRLGSLTKTQNEDARPDQIEYVLLRDPIQRCSSQTHRVDRVFSCFNRLQEQEDLMNSKNLSSQGNQVVKQVCFVFFNMLVHWDSTKEYYPSFTFIG